MKNHTFRATGTMMVLTLTALQSLAQSIYEPYTFTTLAGSAGYGSADGTGSAARFSSPAGVAVDTAGNVYVADYGNNTIRKVTPAGGVTTLAGLAGTGYEYADGTGRDARFYRPTGVTVDSAGNIYVADGSNAIRQVTPSGVVTTLAGRAGSDDLSVDGTGSTARIFSPFGVAVDSAGNVYVAETSMIRKVTPAGVVTTLAGLARNPGNADGTGSNARFDSLSGIAVDSADNLYVADTDNDTIRKVTPTGVVTTLAGRKQLDAWGQRAGGSTDGTGDDARFYIPKGVAVDSAGNVYVADSGNNTIRKISPAGLVTTLAGIAGADGGSADGAGMVARFNWPEDVAVDGAGNVFVSDWGNATIRKVTPTGVVTTLAGLPGGPGNVDATESEARFDSLSGIAVDSAENIFVADRGNHTIRKVSPSGVVTTLADVSGSTARFNYPSGIAVDRAGTVYWADSVNNTIHKLNPEGVLTTLAGLAQLDANGNSVGGSVDGTGSAARFWNPSGVAVDRAGNIYVADTFNNTIRKITEAGVVTTLAGLAQLDANGNSVGGSVDGTGSAARFSYPTGVAVDSAGNVYVTEQTTIRKVTPLGGVTTLAGRAGFFGSTDGKGSAARFGAYHRPGLSGVAVDIAGNVYVADTSHNTIRKVTPEGVVTTLAGGGNGSADGTGSAAQFSQPFDVAVDSAGNVYVADSGNYTIRKGYRYPPPLILDPAFIGGQFRFNLTGPSGQSVVVEVSTDLVNWEPVRTNTFAGLLNFSDPPSGVASNRFYRALLP